MGEPLEHNKLHQQGFNEDELFFIKQHIHDDINQLILKASQFKNVDAKKLAAQILSRQKAAKKLPEWYANEKLIFPPALSVEQSSSEATAKYKAGIASGQRLIDITGGMGVDCYYMSQHFQETLYFEQQEEVAATAEYNFKALENNKIQVNNADSILALEQQLSISDWIYADPARRDSNKNKVVLLSDCTPDVVSNIDLLLKTAPNILIKTSPLLDIDLAVRELKNVKEVHITGYEHECKELLFLINRDYVGDFQLKVRILDSSGSIIQSLNFDREMERFSLIEFANPLSFLYEPHAAVLKSGAFKVLGSQFGLKKLAVSSHLYTSGTLIENFPGRTFKVVGTCKPDIQEILKFTGESKANLTLRNFPAKIHDLRKKWRLKEGGDFYLFGTTLHDHKKIIVVTKKL